MTRRVRAEARFSNGYQLPCALGFCIASKVVHVAQRQAEGWPIAVGDVSLSLELAARWFERTGRTLLWRTIGGQAYCRPSVQNHISAMPLNETVRRTDHPQGLRFGTWQVFDDATDARFLHAERLRRSGWCQ